MSTAPAIIRPYTSYNLFFQLEREYIIQTLHGFQPTIASKDMFDPTNRSTYQGPPLPSRYANLVLPYDWHIPGKTRRRKRSHRKTHGKIGFHELNELISKAWSAVDTETRSYCTRLSDIDARKYKTIKSKTTVADKAERKQRKDKKAMSRSTKKENKDYGYSNDISASSDWAIGIPQDDVAIYCSRHNVGISSPNIFHVITRGNEEQEDGATTTMKPRDPISETEVDISDDEIMAMWRRWHPEDDGIPSHLCQRCVKDPDQSQGKDTQDCGRMSFIDEEYGRFKEIGNQFRQRLPGRLQRNVFVAYQA